MLYIVTYQAPGSPDQFYLRGTVWTGQESRADHYTSAGAARDALREAAIFNPKAARRALVLPARERVA